MEYVIVVIVCCDIKVVWKEKLEIGMYYLWSWENLSKEVNEFDYMNKF